MPGIAACFGKEAESIVQQLLDGFTCRVEGERRVVSGPGFTIAGLGIDPLAFGSVVAVIDGVLHNYLQLAEEMRAEGHKLTTKDPAEVICALYGDFGPDGCRLLDGELALILADEAGEPYLFRDRYSGTPLFYGVTPSGGLAAASERSAVEAVAKQVRELPAATFYSRKTGELTYFEAPPGSAYIFDEVSALALVRYHVLEAVERRISGAGRVAVISDGGTASKLVAAYALRHGAKVEVFVDGRKSSSIGNLASAVGLKITEVDTDVTGVGSIASCAATAGQQVDVVSMATLAHAATKDGHSVLLTAAGSDELFGTALLVPQATPEQTHERLRQLAAARGAGTFAAVAAASAAVGIYICAVFADPNVAMAAWELSPVLKYRDGQPGWPLEELLTQAVADAKVLTA